MCPDIRRNTCSEAERPHNISFKLKLDDGLNELTIVFHPTSVDLREVTLNVFGKGAPEVS